MIEEERTLDVIKTKRWIVDKDVDSFEACPQITEAALWIKQNEIVAFPTETVYGLGANAFSSEAVAKIFTAKGRPSDNPLIVHIANNEQLQLLTKATEIPKVAQELIDEFWPGPLTLVLNHKGEVSRLVTAGLSTVAVRMPDHPLALALIKEVGVPVAAPSANRSGRPSPTTAEHVAEDLAGKIVGIVDGGATGVGVESTVVDCTTEVPMILRPGGISREQLEMVIGPIAVDPALTDEGQAPKSPGVKYRHYAPNTPLVVVEVGSVRLEALVKERKRTGLKVGVLTTIENKDNYSADVVKVCGSRADLNTVAAKLYDTLRSFDQHDLDIIYSESFPLEGVGTAIMNRLEKAAGGNVLR